MLGGMPALERMARSGQRLAMTAGFTAVALLLAVTGIGLLVVALYLWLAILVEPPLAALLAAVVLFLLAATVILIGRAVANSRYRKAAARARAAAAVHPADVASLIGSELGMAGITALKGHVPQVMLAAAAAGFLIGVSPRLRAAIRRQLPETVRVI